MREKESMKRLALALCLSALAAPALDAQAAQEPRTGSSAQADSGWTLVPASDWRTRAPGLIGRRVELSGNLYTQPPGGRSSTSSIIGQMRFNNIGQMRGTIRGQVVATVSFDQISDEQIEWMARNGCLLTCAGVFVRGVVEMVGAGPALQMTDISFESRAGRGAATPALAAPALDAQDARPAPQTGASSADSEWTLVQATDWPTRAPGLIGKRVEVFGNLSVDPSSGFRSTGVMTGLIRHRIVATVSFDRISNEQVTWMTENNCLLTCRGVFVRGVVVIVGAGPVLQMIDISFKSRAAGVDSTVALAAPATDAPGAAADSGWTLVQASDWRTRAPGLIGRRGELSGDLSTQFSVHP